MMFQRPSKTRHHATARGENSKRRGSMALAAMMSLLVIVGGVALALDRLWLDNAKTELETAVEAAALRSGQLLASDDLLRLDADIESRLEHARHEAGRIARENLIAGMPVELNLDAEGDIRFGRVIHRERTGEDVFVETIDGPTSVVVRGLHSRSRNNPVATLLNGATGNDGADVSALSEASIDNRIVGFQPMAGVPIPVLPLAILEKAKDGDARESWQSQIEDRQGSDQFGYDERTGEITRGPDGIPEIHLRSAIRRGDPGEANVHVFDVSGSSTIDGLMGQFQDGWSEEDLPNRLTEFRLDQRLDEFDTVDGIHGSTPRVLEETIGQCRILFLYKNFLATGRSGAGRIEISRAVAGRVLSVNVLEDDGCELIIQPGVMTTRTAILADDDSGSNADRRKRRGSADDAEQVANRYIYKLQITN